MLHQRVAGLAAEFGGALEQVEGGAFERDVRDLGASSFVALVAPAKTPAPVLAKLRAEVAKVLSSPDIVKRLAEIGSETCTAFEDDVRAFLDGETKKWAEVIRVSGAKAD
jgi:tripartite-type tricarboxylate transporter receptor subunit TctC